MFDSDYIPRLFDADGDVSKRWYIDFRIWDTDKGEFVRKQYTGMNKHKTLSARRQAAKKKLAEIKQLLKDGYTAGKSHLDHVSGLDWQKVTVSEAIAYIRDQKRLRRGIEEYNRLLRRLGKGEYTTLGTMPVRLVRPLHVAGFMAYLNQRTKRNGELIGPKSYNHYRNTLSTVFNRLVVLEAVPKNPCLGIERLQVAPSPMHLPYSNEQRAAVRAELERRGDYQMLLYISFIYYCFIRSGGELRLLRVRDLHAKTVLVPAARAKNDQAEHIAIPSKLEEMIQQYRLREYPPDYYVFTHDGHPGPKPVGPNYFPLRHRRILRLAGIVDEAHTIYGYKHTGAVNLYLATNDIELVRRHCRHAHAGITATYLRGLGALHDGEAVDAIPDF
ncbi:hypothetical protein GCM10023185_38360 [Hymenobacter saemangeumensis]|uniref:Tyr recombinase domain-containing protein n=1 Tax=Hymenobacter saemangeumensis TaxID=1084522 RepID=A0ABP8IQM5_9BACT